MSYALISWGEDVLEKHPDINGNSDIKLKAHKEELQKIHAEMQEHFKE